MEFTAFNFNRYGCRIGLLLTWHPSDIIKYVLTSERVRAAAETQNENDRNEEGVVRHHEKLACEHN